KPAIRPRTQDQGINQGMRVANSDCRSSKEQWHPPGHPKKHGSGVAFDPAVYFKGVKCRAQCCTQQEQPEYCPCPLGYFILRVSRSELVQGERALARLKGETHADACEFDQIAALVVVGTPVTITPVDDDLLDLAHL